MDRFHPVHSTEEKNLLRKKYGFLSNDFILIYIAEFIPRKNHKLLFNILPELKIKIPELKLILCGKGELLEYYKQIAFKYKLDYIIFTGYTSHVADFCRLSDVLVMPSQQEGLPLSMIEAIATGLPVVASKIRGHVDVIDDCINGFLLKKSDLTGFVKSIYTLYKNPLLCIQMGKRNILKAQNYSVEKAVSTMEEIYKNVMY